MQAGEKIEGLHAGSMGNYTRKRVRPHGTSRMLPGSELQILFILQREAQQRVRAFQAQLPADTSSMVLDRSIVDGKLRSNLFARFVGGDQLKDAAFGGVSRLAAVVARARGWSRRAVSAELR